MAIIDTPVGRIRITEDGQAITGLEYVSPRARLSQPITALSKRAAQQIRQYFRQPARRFDLPLKLAGTDFQCRVWRALQAIPPGRTLTYGELAKKLNSGPRAIGNACRQNPVPVIVPCHRVVASQGLGGYGGHTRGAVLERKRRLLAHEGVLF